VLGSAGASRLKDQPCDELHLLPYRVVADALHGNLNPERFEISDDIPVEASSWGRISQRGARTPFAELVLTHVNGQRYSGN